MSDARLRIGVLLDRPAAPPNWLARLLDEICNAAQLGLCCLIKAADGPPTVEAGALLRGWSRLEQAVAAPHRRSERQGDAALRKGVPVVWDDQVSELDSLDLDVVLDVSGRYGRTLPAALARHGLWFFDFDPPEVGRAGLHAVIATDPVTRISLFRRSGADHKPTCLATATLNTKFVAARNAQFMAEKSVGLAIRELRRVQRSGRVDEGPDLPFVEPSLPTLRQFMRYLSVLGRGSGSRLAELVLARLRLRPGMFHLSFSSGDALSFDPARGTPASPPANHYQADPFLWEHDGQTFCFFEDYDYATRKGSIGVSRIDGGMMVDVRDALSADYHLSFPFLLEDDGKLYMLPETCAARRVETWRCVEFPDRWERHAVTLEGVMAADSTLTKIGGGWWLFTNISTDPFGDMNSELHIFSVSGPDLKDCVPHPLNPVVFDSRTARNAGRIFEKDGSFYRPSQDNSHGLYGYGLNLMRIDRLTSSDYSEVLVHRIQPDFARGISGCHHVDARCGRVVVDVRRKVGGWQRRRSPSAPEPGSPAAMRTLAPVRTAI